MDYIFYYYFVLSFITFFLFGLDKIKAIKKMRRIKETTLFLFSFLGGFVGSFLAMILFRHKIKKIKFLLMYIFLVLIHLSIVYVIWRCI